MQEFLLSINLYSNLHTFIFILEKIVKSSGLELKISYDKINNFHKFNRLLDLETIQYNFHINIQKSFHLKVSFVLISSFFLLIIFYFSIR